jgi:hypothetical protein
MRPAVHPLLVAAHEAVHASSEQWNPKRHSLTRWEPPHLGGPQPVVSRRAQVEIVLWCAELAASRLAPAVRQPLLKLLAAVREPTFTERTESEKRAVIAALRALEPATAADTDPLRLAGLASVATRRLVTRAWRNAHRTTLEAVTLTTRILARASEPRAMPPEVFVDALDERLMRAEWVGFADRTQTARRLYGNAGSRLDTLLFRAGDDKGDGAVWVARLKSNGEGSTAGRSIAALVRNRGFQFAEGTPNDALAIVPDEYLEAAADAVLGGPR